jgi:hypothetical protein
LIPPRETGILTNIKRGASYRERRWKRTEPSCKTSRLFGGGEWFTRVNKRSQKMELYTYDAYRSQTPKTLRDDPLESKVERNIRTFATESRRDG